MECGECHSIRSDKFIVSLHQFATIARGRAVAYLDRKPRRHPRLARSRGAEQDVIERMLLSVNHRHIFICRRRAQRWLTSRWCPIGSPVDSHLPTVWCVLSTKVDEYAFLS